MKIIKFTPEMHNAVISGTKTETRRIIKSQPKYEIGDVCQISVESEPTRTLIYITNVRIERLYDVDDFDALDEGVEHTKKEGETYIDAMFKDYTTGKMNLASATSSFLTLFESIYGKEKMRNDPWLWVYEFKLVNQ